MYLSIIIAIMIFMFGMLFLNFIMPEITNTRTSLDCTNSTISDGNKAMCLLTDTVVPYFIILVFSGAGGLIVARLVL